MEPLALPEPPEETSAFFAMVRSRLARREPSFRFLGTVEQAIVALGGLAACTRSSVWNMQRFTTFYSVRDGRELTEDSRRRGVAERLVMGPLGLAMCPIASSYVPHLRTGPVTNSMLLLDSRIVVVAGIDGGSLWTSQDDELVRAAVGAYEATWQVAHPAVAPGDDPPLTPRMLDVAWLLADGATDRRISRELGISQRTVSAEVAEIGRRLGGANRAHTIARICGAPH